MQTLNMLSQVVSMNLEELAIIGTTLTSIVASTTYLATKHFTERSTGHRRRSPMEGTRINWMVHLTGWTKTILNFSFTKVGFGGLKAGEPFTQQENITKILFQGGNLLNKGQTSRQRKVP